MKREIQYLKSRFEKGDIPTQDDFGDLIDSTYNTLEGTYKFEEYNNDVNLLVNRSYILKTTNSSLTATLPEFAEIGEFINIITELKNDYKIHLNLNYNLLDGLETHLVCDVNAFFTLIYINESVGWKFKPYSGYGLVGMKGKEGIQGATGATGPIGATGVSIIGSTGATGLQGATGNIGSIGSTGATGIPGLEGSTGYPYIGATGLVGDTGATGFGNIGATGVEGNVGATGATGIGEKGDTGATGIIGIAGSTGATGPNGSIGATGATGPAGALANTIYVNYNELDIQQAVDAATQGKVISVSSGSFDGTTLTIANKQNIAIICPPRGQGTICELSSGRGLTLASTSTGSISINALQVEGLTTLAGSGNNYFTQMQCQNGIAISAGATGNYFFYGCEISGIVSVPNTFAGALVFLECNFAGASFSLNNFLPLQVQFALCTNLPNTRPTNATYGLGNQSANGTIILDGTTLNINSIKFADNTTQTTAMAQGSIGSTGATGIQGDIGSTGATGPVASTAYSSGDIIQERWSAGVFSASSSTNSTTTMSRRGHWILDLNNTTKWTKTGCSGPEIIYRVMGYAAAGGTAEFDLFNHSESGVISNSLITVVSNSSDNISTVTVPQSSFPSTPSLVSSRFRTLNSGINANIWGAEIVATWTVL